MNGILKEYTVTYSVSDDIITKIVNYTSTTLTNLEACTEYDVTVTTTNGRETSEPSNPITGETDIDGIHF